MAMNPVDTKVVSEWTHTGSPLLACRWDPQGRFAFSSAEDQSIQRWNLADGSHVSFTGHESWVFSLVVEPRGEVIVSGGGDGRLVWWPVAAEKPEPIRTVNGHTGWVRALAVSPDGQFLASGGNDQMVRLWNMSDGSLVREFKGHDSHIYSLTFHPSGQWLLTGDLKGSIHKWEVATGALLHTVDAKALWSYNAGQGVDFGGVRALTISTDSKFFAAGGLNNASNPLGAVHDPVVLLFDWETRLLVQTHIADGLKGSIWRLVFHPEGWLIGASGGSSGGFVSFWKPENPKEAYRLKLPNIVRDLDLHRDGLQLCTAHYDQRLRVSRMAPPA